MTDRGRAVVAALRRAHQLPDDLPGRTERLEERLADVERELIRVSPQLAAVEERLADLRERILDPDWTGDDADRAEARELIDEVRRQHRQIRERITAATVFEERLRVLEKRAGIDSLTGRPR
jgi:chromosome segregation ATPase